MITIEEVCYECTFYDKKEVEPKNRCKARAEIRDNCSYWDKDKMCIDVDKYNGDELKSIDRE